MDNAAFEAVRLARDRLDISIRAVAQASACRVETHLDAWHTENDWPLQYPRAIASASCRAGGKTVTGYGGGGNPQQAGVHAAMECIERYAQFRTDIPAPEALLPWNAACEHALSPLAF